MGSFPLWAAVAFMVVAGVITLVWVLIMALKEKEEKGEVDD